MQTHQHLPKAQQSQHLTQEHSNTHESGQDRQWSADNSPGADKGRRIEEPGNENPDVHELHPSRQLADNSREVKQLRSYQQLALNSSRVQKGAQLQSSIDTSPLVLAQRQRIQHTLGDSAVQRKNAPEEEAQKEAETAQMKAYTHAGADISDHRKEESPEERSVQGTSETVQKKKNDTGLPDNLKSGIETLSGYSMDDVKVHYNSSKPAQLQAHAYAQGTDIHVASGQERHLPHEAWHVVQQKQGIVKPTMQMKGKVAVNDDAGLEKEADFMGMKALRSNASSDVPTQLKSNNGHGQGCDCPSCGNCQPFLQMKTVENATVQRFTTVSIEDDRGKQASGKSGNEESTRSSFAKWPELQKSFESKVHPVEMPEINDSGEETGEKYARNGYMCAEPNALGSLLHHYNHVDHSLNDKWLNDLKFPELAVDNKTGQKIKPCPVCSQWVTENAPMAIKGLSGGKFTNKAQLDHREKLKEEERVLLEAEAEKAREKEQKKKEKERVQSESEAKNGVIEELQKLSPELIFNMIKDAVSAETAETWELYDRKKKLVKAKLKEFSDDCISKWITGLKITNIHIINTYKALDKEESYQNDFKEWVRKNVNE